MHELVAVGHARSSDGQRLLGTMERGGGGGNCGDCTHCVGGGETQYGRVCRGELSRREVIPGDMLQCSLANLRTYEHTHAPPSSAEPRIAGILRMPRRIPGILRMPRRILGILRMPRHIPGILRLPRRIPSTLLILIHIPNMACHILHIAHHIYT